MMDVSRSYKLRLPLNETRFLKVPYKNDSEYDIKIEATSSNI